MLTSDFKKFAELLLSNEVEFLIIGGYALAAYGKDIVDLDRLR